MSAKRMVMYAVVLGAGAAAGNRIENYLKTQPLQKEVYRLSQELEKAGEKLGKYTVRLAGGRIAELNPDMSVTVSGIAGERTVDMQPQEFRKLRK